MPNPDGTPLQWGRGLKTPEMHTLHYGGIDASWLQWGRGLKTPEIRPQARTGAPERRASMGPGS